MQATPSIVGNGMMSSAGALRTQGIERLRRMLEIDAQRIEVEKLPFVGDDVTVGTENELQAAVLGSSECVDLPWQILESTYYRNVQRKTESGEMTGRLQSLLDAFVHENKSQTWENSWVTFSRNRLSPYALQVFDLDLSADKHHPGQGRRTDWQRFSCRKNGEAHLRIPISYLLKLALADAISASDDPQLVRSLGMRGMNHFLSDNTSPETFSFQPVQIKGRQRSGPAIAMETSLRYLLSQLLVQYANEHFGLRENGQQAIIYLAPNPPVRQQQLNELIPDSFYRELFMSPCLSGWDCGEKKHAYMHLCHRVLSHSQLHAVAKLKEAGIITNNLVVMPTLSNISLANNGTHISFGSRKLTRLCQAESDGFRPGDEKYYGDLVIKIMEHFLPLFVGTYSAAPYRLAFSDFHPEKVLGFLPHELDFTHLRMIWRRWKKKARLGVLGTALTPFGPQWLDRTIATLLRLRGDFLLDYRLIDYLVCLLSTEECPALDGKLGNQQRLTENLAAMGVFDRCMAIYLLFRQRCFDTMGFCGFEARHFSLFGSLQKDMAPAADLQALLLALANKYVLSGRITHADIPDTPHVESERRQVFFGSAIGIPTFFVRKKTPNRLMSRLVQSTERTRSSRRYPGYTRVHNSAYRYQLLQTIRKDGADLIEAMGLEEVIADLQRRLEKPKVYAASGRLTQAILDHAGTASPLKMDAQDFNAAAENYYREPLKRTHLEEAYDILEGQAGRLDDLQTWRQGFYNRTLLDLLRGGSALEFLKRARRKVLDEGADAKVLRKMIHLMLLVMHQQHELAPVPSENV